MAKTVYFTATSIDGFIADADGGLDWLAAGDTRRDDHFGAFFADVGAFAMGATTYAWVLDHEGLREHPHRWRDWYGDVPAWVFTHQCLPRLPGADITFVQGDVRPVHARMRAAAAGKDIWLTGGGELVAAFADHGLLDEIVLGVAPALLGAGAPLLPRRLVAPRIALTEVRRDGQFAYLTYAVT